MTKKIAILVGVSNYQNTSPLPPCDNDLQLMTAIVKASGAFDDLILLDNSPISIHAKDQISNFIKKYQNDKIQEIFFYYTGHGMRYLDDFLFLFADFNKSKIEQTALRNSELDSMIKSLNPELAVKVVDACYAGTEYIKSDQDLKLILEKSQQNGFNKTYFLFSSSVNQTSIALPDFSIFTKSFAKALLNHLDKPVRYRDIMAYISDDNSVSQHQTPLFIQQANNTEVFCSVSVDLINAIKSEISIQDDSLNTQSNDKPIEATFEDRLIASVKEKSKDYCTEEEAKISLSNFVKLVQEYNWGNVISSLYEIEPKLTNDFSNVTGMSAIGKWLSGNGNLYFAEVDYVKEAYEAKERVEVEKEPGAIDHSFSRLFGTTRTIEYKPVTRYREVIAGIKHTAPSPCCSIDIHLCPKEESLSWYRVFVVYIFSKSDLTIFAKHEIEQEISWNQRITANSNAWMTTHCKLKNYAEIGQSVSRLLEDIEETIVNEVSAKFNILEI